MLRINLCTYICMYSTYVLRTIGCCCVIVSVQNLHNSTSTAPFNPQVSDL